MHFRSAVLPSLPHEEGNPTRRRQLLQAQQKRYGYKPAEQNLIAPIAIAGRLPLSEGYGPRWALPHLPQLFRSLRAVVLGGARHGRRAGAEPADKPEAFAELYRLAGIRTPAVLADPLMEDRWFARGWLDGPNPLLLSRVTSATELERLAARDYARLLQALPTGLGPARACEEARLFVVDYELLHRGLLDGGSVGRDTRFREKYLPAPLVFFLRDEAPHPTCDLAPIAIRIDRAEAHGHNPLYLPGDGKAWELAKIYVHVADFNQQTLSSHIQRHHFLLEAIALATHRQLAARHPLHVLLTPHIAYTFAVNRAATQLLGKRGGVFDNMYAGRLPETRRILMESHARFDFCDLELRRDLVNRGVESQPVEFPYRDDALLWVGAIERFVQAYVNQFYASDARVAGDLELCAWLDELGDPRRGNQRGLRAGSGKLESRAALAALLTQILFAAGPGHAAAHYPQTDFMTYAATHPGAAYRPPPGPNDTVSDERIAGTLPPYSRALLQFFTNQIAYYRYDRFGDYRGYALDRVAETQPYCDRLRAELRDIELEIGRRNARRARPYPYLRPALVPNSINI